MIHREKKRIIDRHRERDMERESERVTHMCRQDEIFIERYTEPERESQIIGETENDRQINRERERESQKLCVREWNRDIER